MERNIFREVFPWLLISGAGIVFFCSFFTYLFTNVYPFVGCGCCCDLHWRTPDMPQLQANLRPYEVPIENSVTPSAPRLDQVDLPPSYEEAVKITFSKS